MPTPPTSTRTRRQTTPATPPPPDRTSEPGTPSGRPFRVLVTGSRAWTRRDAVTTALDALKAEHGPALVVIHGGCPQGADAIAAAWATATGTTVHACPADWTAGRGAGPARNLAMVAAGADLCLAFILDTSPGASHCARVAEAAGIPVRRITATTPGRARGSGGLARRDVLVAAALAYAEHGWPVFPLRPGDKRPAFPDHPEDRCTRRDPRCRRAGRHVTWEERATTDPARIHAAWTRAPFGIGIAAGPSGLLIIDLDTPKPDAEPLPPEWALPGVVDGADTWCLLADRAGHPVPLATYTAATPSGGLHLYFTAPPDTVLHNTTKQLAPMIDTRGHGGYVAAPPTVLLPREGRTPGAYQVLDDTPPAPLPAWLAQRLAPRPLPAPGPVRATLRRAGGRGGDARREAYLDAAVNGQLARIADAAAEGPGRRNKALYLSATALGQLVAGGCLAEAEVTRWLTDAATAAGLTGAEISRTIASGLRAGTARPRSLDIPGTTTGTTMGQGQVAA